jgi:hypothetical protein
MGIRGEQLSFEMVASAKQKFSAQLVIYQPAHPPAISIRHSTFRTYAILLQNYAGNISLSTQKV